MKYMKEKWALITGASSGIGRELAYIHAINGGNVLLVSRSKDVLETLKQEIIDNYNVQVDFLPLDLTDKNSIVEIANYLKKQDLELHCLINNAGYGGYGRFSERRIESDGNMIDLNIKALVELTHYCMPFMSKSESSYIMNVASIAAYFPGPFQATYFASKAFVLSFSHALSSELKDSKTSVTAVCPGPVNTNFEKKAEMESLGFFKNAQSAKLTALRAYRGMLKKRKEIITDFNLSIPLRIILPFMPRRLRSYIIYRIQKPTI